MKTAYILTFTMVLLIASKAFTQINFNTDSLAIEVCECVDSSSKQAGIKEEFLSQCVQFHFSNVNPANVIDTLITEISPYEQGKAFGDSIAGVLIKIIIDDCEVWASYMYDLRESGFKKMVDKSQKRQIAQIKKEIKQNDTEENQVELGVCYLRDGDMLKARKQLDYCLAKYPNSIGVLLFGAIYQELNNNLDRALIIYEAVYEVYPDYSIYTIISLLKRKIRLQDQ